MSRILDDAIENDRLKLGNRQKNSGENKQCCDKVKNNQVAIYLY